MKFDALNIHTEPILAEELDLNTLFDKNGMELYNELENEYIFSFSYYNQDSPAINLNGIYAEFLIPQSKNMCKNLFTHELLHLYLLFNGINNKLSLLNSIGKYNLSEVLSLSENEIIYIHNFLDHIIMYNDFKNMGYKDNEFVVDYNEDRFNKDVSFYLEYRFKYNSPDDYAISFFISKYIGLRSPVCRIRDYSKAYKLMKSLNRRLYDVCKEFVDEYISIAHEDYSYIKSNYESIIDRFVSNLKQTMKKPKA